MVTFITPNASAADGTDVFVTYFDAAADDIYFKKSTDAGVTWSAPVRLTYIGSPGVDDPYPSMVYSPGTGYFHIVFGVYIDPTYGDEIYYKSGH
jgi:hypothetical protein